MTIYSCRCLQCEHNFFCLETDCRAMDWVCCPLCQGGVDVDDCDKPEDKKWSRCNHSNEVNCKNCPKKTLKIERDDND